MTPEQLRFVHEEQMRMQHRKKSGYRRIGLTVLYLFCAGSFFFTGLIYLHVRDTHKKVIVTKTVERPLTDKDSATIAIEFYSDHFPRALKRKKSKD